jgi:lipopolysaccharide/colanic/teichoic acid biosynthesis glycosyltransferase
MPMRRGWGIYQRFGKRLLDLLLVVLSAPVWIPLLVGLCVATRLRMGSPVFFRQSRAGFHGKPFHIVKLRTMTDAVDPQGRPLSDAERLTPFGRWLRTTSLDELPELLNVLGGQMSLVGPRPLLTRYVERYSPAQRRRLDVLPGLTGWSQIHGRNALGWEQKFALDGWYVDNLSARTDLLVLFKTAAAVLTRQGIAAEGEATMPEFTGQQHNTAPQPPPGGRTKL